MTHLPQHIQDHLKSLGVNFPDAAYVHVTTAGQVIHTGGALAIFKLNTARIGEDITRNASLAHLLPVKAATMLSCVQVTPGIYADIHLFPDNDWAWLIFVNVTNDAAKRQADQQHRNDAALQRHRDSKAPEKHQP